MVGASPQPRLEPCSPDRLLFSGSATQRGCPGPSTLPRRGGSLHWHHCRENGTEVPVLALLGMEIAWGGSGGTALAQGGDRDSPGTAARDTQL